METAHFDAMGGQWVQFPCMSVQRARSLCLCRLSSSSSYRLLPSISTEFYKTNLVFNGLQLTFYELTRAMAVKLRFFLVAAILHGAITTLLPASPYPPSNAAAFVVVTGQVLQPFRLRYSPPQCLAASCEAVRNAPPHALCSFAPLYKTMWSCRAWVCKTGSRLRRGSWFGQPCAPQTIPLEPSRSSCHLRLVVVRM